LFTIENYGAASLQRQLDMAVLHNQGRKIGAIHFGGIAIECLLKNMIVQYHALSSWDSHSKQTGQPITNPKHILFYAVRSISTLQLRVTSNPEVRQLIKDVQQPFGDHYIEWRYVGTEPNTEKYDEWYQSYNKLRKWLIEQSKNL